MIRQFVLAASAVALVSGAAFAADATTDATAPAKVEKVKKHAHKKAEKVEAKKDAAAK